MGDAGFIKRKIENVLRIKLWIVLNMFNYVNDKNPQKSKI
jgi:hypothetical protein